MNYSLLLKPDKKCKIYNKLKIFLAVSLIFAHCEAEAKGFTVLIIKPSLYIYYYCILNLKNGYMLLKQRYQLLRISRRLSCFIHQYHEMNKSNIFLIDYGCLLLMCAITIGLNNSTDL